MAAITHGTCMQKRVGGVLVVSGKEAGQAFRQGPWCPKACLTSPRAMQLGQTKEAPPGFDLLTRMKVTRDKERVSISSYRWGGPSVRQRGHAPARRPNARKTPPVPLSCLPHRPGRDVPTLRRGRGAAVTSSGTRKRRSDDERVAQSAWGFAGVPRREKVARGEERRRPAAQRGRDRKGKGLYSAGVRGSRRELRGHGSG